MAKVDPDIVRLSEEISRQDGFMNKALNDMCKFGLNSRLGILRTDGHPATWAMSEDVKHIFTAPDLCLVIWFDEEIHDA